MRGPADYFAIIGMMRGSFPDIQWTLEEMSFASSLPFVQVSRSC
jgi:hypothetical protein